MANPNMTVANARNQKTFCLAEYSFNCLSDAENKAAELKKNGTKARVSKYKIGPRNDPTTKYMVREYA